MKIIFKTIYNDIIIETEKYNNIKELLQNEKLNLRNANLRNADLYNANLCDANLYNADLHNANLDNANLRNANLCDANLCDADLRNADLYNANLCDANLCNANLCDANLCYADLYNANLRNANLCDANLYYADLRNVKLNYSFKKKIVSNLFLMNRIFKNTKNYWIVYKSFQENFKSPKKWDIKKNQIIKNRIDENRWHEYGCGINVGTLEWCKDNCKNQIYQLHVSKTAEICVPYFTDGKVRVSEAKIIKQIRS